MKVTNGKLMEKIGRMEESIEVLKENVKTIKENDLAHICDRLSRLEKVIWGAIGALTLLEFILKYIK